MATKAGGEAAAGPPQVVVRKVIVVEFGGSQIKLVKFLADEVGLTAYDDGLQQVVKADQIPWFGGGGAADDAHAEVVDLLVSAVRESVDPNVPTLLTIFVSGGHLTKAEAPVDISDNAAKLAYLQGPSPTGNAIRSVIGALHASPADRIPTLVPDNQKDAEMFLFTNEAEMEAASLFRRYVETMEQLAQGANLDETLLLLAGSASCQFVRYMSGHDMNCRSVSLEDLVLGNIKPSDVLDDITHGEKTLRVIFASNYAFEIFYQAMNSGMNVLSDPSDAQRHFVRRYFRQDADPNFAEPLPADADALSTKAVHAYKPDKLTMMQLDDVAALGPFARDGTSTKKRPLAMALDGTIEWLQAQHVKETYVFKQCAMNGRPLKAGAAHGAALQGLQQVVLGGFGAVGPHNRELSGDWWRSDDEWWNKLTHTGEKLKQMSMAARFVGSAEIGG